MRCLSRNEYLPQAAHLILFTGHLREGKSSLPPGNMLGQVPASTLAETRAVESKGVGRAEEIRHSGNRDDIACHYFPGFLRGGH